MPLAPNSAGLGHGPLSRGFGYGPFGHGGWVTWTPPRPDYGVRDETAYATQVLVFEDRTEERWRLHGDEARRLTIPLGRVDSATLLSVRSFYGGAVGGLTRFRIADYRTGSEMIVRFASALTTTWREGRLSDLEPVSVVRAHPYDVGTSTVSSGGDWDAFFPSRSWRHPDTGVTVAGLAAALGAGTTTAAALTTGQMVGVPFPAAVARRLRALTLAVCSATTSAWLAVGVYEQAWLPKNGAYWGTVTGPHLDFWPGPLLWQSPPIIPYSTGVYRFPTNVSFLAGRTYFAAVTVEGTNIPTVRCLVPAARAVYCVEVASFMQITHYVTSGIARGVMPALFVSAADRYNTGFHGTLGKTVPAIGLEFGD